MSEVWDAETDFLVAGSGAAGMSAAITAHKNGLDVIIVESMDRWGGTTAISGGGLWMPNNPIMKGKKIEDNAQAAFDYLKETIGEPGPWANDTRKWAFINAIPHFVNMMADEGIRWMSSTKYADYYPDLKGGRIGRGIESRLFNYRKLGHYGKLVMDGGLPLPVHTDDVWLLSRAWVSWGGFWRGAKMVGWTLGSLILGMKLRGMGYAYAGSLMYIVQNREIPVWLNSPITDVIKDDKGRVIGAIVKKDGKEIRIKTSRGVMLAAGGFAHNTEMRMKYQGVPGWSVSPRGQLGQGIVIGQKAGGQLAMMEDAWWGAVPVNSKQQASGFMLAERSMPHSLMVNKNGQRFANESESYIDIGHHILETTKKEKDPQERYVWLIMDHQHSKRYLNSSLLIGTKDYAKAGHYAQAPTLRALANKIGVDYDNFKASVDRFNQFAITGVDRDFQRGRTAYDRYYSDPSVKPNPNLGRLDKGPFSALRAYAGDLNTKGGLITDEYSRVTDKEGKPIVGLYAAGNTTASVMGYTYPGPGSTIAPASVFGYLGALHAARFKSSGPADFAGR